MANMEHLIKVNQKIYSIDRQDKHLIYANFLRFDLIRIDTKKNTAVVKNRRNGRFQKINVNL